jgi:Transposase IS66 family
VTVTGLTIMSAEPKWSTQRWAHARRKFFEAVKVNPRDQTSIQIVAQMDELFAIDEKALARHHSEKIALIDQFRTERNAASIALEQKNRELADIRAAAAANYETLRMERQKAEGRERQEAESRQLLLPRCLWRLKPSIVSGKLIAETGTPNK